MRLCGAGGTGYNSAVPLRVRPSLLVLFPALVPACADWPRFAADSEPIGAFGSLHPIEVIEDGDWPDDPAGAGAAVAAELTVPMDSVRFSGSLDPYGTWVFDANAQPFPSCPGITSGIEGHYEGDVDVFRIRHPGHALCLHLEAPDAKASSPWDVVAYAWNGNCAFGPFLTSAWEGGADVPATTAPGLTSRADDFGIRDVVLYVASGLQDPDAPSLPEVAYTLDVVATSDAGSCSTLTPANFGDPR